MVDAKQPTQVIGRYALFDKIASGGMASVYYGRLLGPVGFARTVAVKKLHPQFSRDPEFVGMFVDEARLAARIRHPNVVPTLDVVAEGRELYLVMEYVLGITLSELLHILRQRRERIPGRIVSGILSGCLRGLHAAHETCDDNGRQLGIVHRDVSPHNIMVGRDGMARVLDFGIAKAANRTQTTRHGDVKGKVTYMAPEQLRAREVSRQADIYAAAVTLWEALTCRKVYTGTSDEVLVMRGKGAAPPRPSTVDLALVPFDEVVMRGLKPAAEERFESAREMAEALERCIGSATPAQVADWLEEIAPIELEQRAKSLAAIERDPSVTEVRAAMRDALAIEGEPAPPADSVTAARSQSDESLEASDSSIGSSTDLTTKEGRTTDDGSAREIGGDPFRESATTVVRATDSASVVTADSAPHASFETLTQMEPLADDREPAAVEAPSSWGDPPETADAPSERTSVPVAIDSQAAHSQERVSLPAAPARSPNFSVVVFGGAFAIIVGGVVAFTLLAAPAESPQQQDASGSTAVSPAAPDEPPAERPAAMATTTPGAEETDVDGAAGSASQAASAEPSSRPHSRRRPRPTTTSKSGDPFDALGPRR